ncbi:MAG: DUF308 domain-containing protein [Lachnospiraceae bacterium]|nr:DUF308 domain-containing protein [Lachnospiraceae bacterium]
MKKLKEMAPGVTGALCELAVGILLLIDPLTFTEWIIRALGVILIIVGVINVVNYFRSSPQTSILQRKLSIGILLLAGGIFCVVNPQWFSAAFPALAVIYGIGTLATGVMKVESAVNMLRLKMRNWWICAISAVVTVACALIIIANPLSTTALLWIFVALALIVEAVIDFVTVFLPPKKEPNEV